MMLRALLASLVIHLILALGLRGEYLLRIPEVPLRGPVLNTVLGKSIGNPGSDALLRPAPALPEPRRTHPTKRSVPQLASTRPAERRAPVFPQNALSTVASIDTASLRREGGTTVAAEIPGQASLRDEYSADGLRQYRLALAREAKRYKRYPSVARERGWEGLVSILVSVPLAGATPVVSVDKSSGYELLDNQALEMIGLAARSAPLPEVLRGGAFSLNLPVRYSLGDN